MRQYPPKRTQIHTIETAKQPSCISARPPFFPFTLRSIYEIRPAAPARLLPRPLRPVFRPALRLSSHRRAGLPRFSRRTACAKLKSMADTDSFPMHFNCFYYTPTEGPGQDFFVTLQPYRFGRSKHACMILTVHADMSLEQKELRSSGKPQGGVLRSSLLLLRGRGLNCCYCSQQPQTPAV